MDSIVYNGETFDIESGLTVDDVRASMRQVYASVVNANIESSDNGNGSKTWTITERGGDKGSL